MPAQSTAKSQVREEWIFTFGSGQRYREESVSHRFVRIPGTYAEARAVMLAYFGNTWCGQYRSPEEAGTAWYGLAELSLKGLVPLGGPEGDVDQYGLIEDGEGE